MTTELAFDLDNISHIEFGVGLDDEVGRSFVTVPADEHVQAALREIASATWDAVKKQSADGIGQYEPSEKHASTECLYLPLNDELATTVRDLHQATNLSVDVTALSTPETMFCYFARFTDTNSRRLTALRRASQFKGVVKSKNRLARVLDDTLEIVGDTVFKLDNDFDLLADQHNVYILRPSGFEFTGRLTQAVLAAVPGNINVLRHDLDFVNLDGLEAYAQSHPRAARYVASIRSQAETANIDRAALKRLCTDAGVEITEENSKIEVPTGSEMAFLEVLDRRRYTIELADGETERFKAASRTRLKK